MSAQAFGPFLTQDGNIYSHFCPGCQLTHTVMVSETSAPGWVTLDGNANAPTFSRTMTAIGNECHYKITAGQIIFTPDCTHALAGQTVAMQAPEPQAPSAPQGPQGPQVAAVRAAPA